MTRLSALILLTLLASCVSPRRAPPAAPPPEPRQAVRPLPPAPPPLDWADRPATPGDWRLQADPKATAALFEGPGARFTLMCDRIGRRVRLELPDAPAARLTIRASSTMRVLASPELAATDPLLDAIAYTRGHFAVERAGAPPLILPAYAEVSRVIDDCRG